MDRASVRHPKSSRYARQSGELDGTRVQIFIDFDTTSLKSATNLLTVTHFDVHRFWAMPSVAKIHFDCAHYWAGGVRMSVRETVLVS
jgi:hypothetical protein